MVSKLKSYLADFTAIERCEIKIKGFEIEILFLNTNVCVCANILLVLHANACNFERNFSLLGLGWSQEVGSMHSALTVLLLLSFLFLFLFFILILFYC